MFASKKILVPLALSPACGWAAAYAAQLARRLKSELLFLHVGNCSRETVEAFLGSKAKGIPHEIKICQGDPADVIGPLARDADVGLIVMPTHAHGRFRRFLLGSVTAKVLHDVDCPVLTGVHHETAPHSAQADIRQMVCAVDTGAGFVPVIRGALEFNVHFNATLTVIHALPAADETSDNLGEIELRKYLFHAAEEQFARLRREVDVDVKIAFAGGAVSTVVREAALRVGADLVVIGRGHTQRTLGRLRTHAYSIIRNSPCPVLSI